MEQIIKKGAWSPEEDQKLRSYIMRYGIWNWRQMPKFAGLSRTGKSCRLRWMNYLRPDVKRGPFTLEEVDTVIKMYQEIGSRWSAIAAKLPGRTDNEVKNFFHTHLKKHFGLKNHDTQLKIRKSRKQTKENEKKNSTRRRAVVGTINNSSSLSTDVCSPCSNIITCEENQMIVSNTKNIGVAEGLEYSQQCSIPDGSTYEQFDMNSFWFDILENF